MEVFTLQECGLAVICCIITSVLVFIRDSLRHLTSQQVQGRIRFCALILDFDEK